MVCHLQHTRAQWSMRSDEVALGFARTLSIPPNTRHAAELTRLERAAALAGRGLWSACE